MKAQKVSFEALGLTILIFAATASFSHAADPREKEWKALCQQELDLGTNQMCVNLRRKNGEFKGPDEVIEHATIQYAPFIRQVAREYNVDPRAIVGAIMAEGSVNQTANYMAAKQMLVRTQQFFGLSQPGKIAGTNKYISIGFGSLHADAAFAVEQLAARIEKRPVRSEAEVTELVNNQPEAAIRYIAAVFRDAIDQYAKYGMADKIKNHPEYLVTLYNVGKVDRLAAATAAEKRDPKVNFLGLWVKWNIPEIERITQANPVAENVNGGSASIQASSTGAATGAKVAQKSPGTVPGSMRMADVVEKAVILSSAPTQCQEGDKTSKATTYQIVATKQRFPTVGTLNPGVPYKVLSPGMGCGFEDWVLVRAEDGTTGWAPKKSVELVHKKNLVASKPCNSDQQAKCEEKLKQSAKGSFIGKALPGRFFVRLQGEGKKLDWAKPDVECDAEASNASTTTNKASSTSKAISSEEAAQLFEAFKKFKASTLAGIQKEWDEAENERYKQALKNYEENQKLNAEGKSANFIQSPFKQSSTIDWSSSENPYSQAFTGMSSTNGKTKSFDEIQNCIKKDEKIAPEKVCFANVKLLLEAFSKPLPPRPSYSELTATATRFAALVPISMQTMAASSSAGAQEAAQALAQKRQDLLDKMANCTKLIKEPGYKFQELDKFMTSLKNAGATAQIWSSVGSIDPIDKECLLMSKLIHNEEITAADTPYSSNTCPVVINGPLGGTSQSNVTMGVFKALFRTKEDIETQMDLYMKNSGGSWLFSSNGGSGSSGNSDPAACKYNPVKTAEWIENLLKNDCIARVYVPDPWLVKRLENLGSKVIMGQMPEPDRMMAEVGGLDCQETTK